MPIQPPPVHLDPDFRPSVRGDSFRASLDSRRYRRLIFNAYPGALLIIVFVAIALWVDLDNPEMPGYFFALAAFCLLGLVYLFPRSIRYYCLDCGRGGRLDGWSRHVCPDVAARIAMATPARLRPPGVAIQFFVQALILGLVMAPLLAWLD